ncbi:MAG: hypothetical protein ACI8QD_001249 [Cyclobacteriaceae bacterium]|jgi:hypothetical protein
MKMIVYNVTVNVAQEVAAEWLEWMKADHIPKVMATGHFVNSKMLKMLSEHPDADGSTYAIQYYSNSIEELNNYLNNKASALQKEHIDKYGDRCLAFRTILEEI